MSLIEKVLSYLGWCPSKKAAADFRPKMKKSFLKNPSVLVIAVVIVGMVTYVYYNATRQSNDIPICVTTDSIEPYLVELAEKDINQYCKDNGYSQRFNFISKEYDDWGTKEDVQGLTDAIAREGFKLVVGYSHKHECSWALESIEEHDLIFISPHSKTSTVTNSSSRFYGVTADTPEIDVMIKAAEAKGIRSLIVIQRDSSSMEQSYREAEGLFQSLGGVVFNRIVYPAVGSTSYTLEENADFTLYCVEANEAVKLAGEDYDLHEIGVLFLGYSNVFPILYQSRDLDYLLEVPWFGRGESHRDIESFPWALEYAHKVGLYQPMEILAPSERVESLGDEYNDQIRARLSGWEDTDFLPEDAELYDSCWLMALSVLEADSAEPSDVSAVFRQVAEGYTGLYGNYAVNEAGDRYRYSVGVFKVEMSANSLGFSTYRLEECAIYDAETCQILPYDNFQ